eukprot:662863-Prymnesium_polylepis.1
MRGGICGGCSGGWKQDATGIVAVVGNRTRLASSGQRHGFEWPVSADRGRRGKPPIGQHPVGQPKARRAAEPLRELGEEVRERLP